MGDLLTVSLRDIFHFLVDAWNWWIDLPVWLSLGGLWVVCFVVFWAVFLPYLWVVGRRMAAEERERQRERRRDALGEHHRLG